jgi:hypothetical protein
MAPSAVVSADFDHDGHPDLAVANTISDSVSVLFGDGRGRFPRVQNFAVIRQPTFLMTGFMNNDHRIDLIVGNQQDEKVSILRGEPGGLAAATVGEMGTTVRPLVSEDFNGDGQIDLAIADESHDRISILLGAGNNAFGEPIYFPAGQHPFAIAAGDFNEDKRLDLAVINRDSHSVLLLLNNSSRSPERPVLPSSTPAGTPRQPMDPWQRAIRAW